MYRDLNNQPVPRKTLEQITIVLQCYLNSPFQFLRTDFTLMYCGDYVSLHEFVLWTYIFRNIVLYHRYTHALIQQIKDYVNVRPILYFYFMYFYWKLFSVFSFHLYFPVTKMLWLEEIINVNNLWENNTQV